ncbi:hypothetical protein ACS7SF_13100 [Ralstonia sp. 25C]|uniref:hypothetical protein n=1 Tax=Ralstonia sp. 25C TaxID=3447363 RepID=UPI003F74DD29
MQEYIGNDLELGPSKPSGLWRTYTYIKVGGKILKKVSVKETLDVVLRDQCKREGACKLWIISWFFRPLIVGITQDDGQTFRQSLGQGYFWAGTATLCMFFSLLLIDTALGKFLFVFFFLCALPCFLLIRKVRKVEADHSY